MSCERVRFEGGLSGRERRMAEAGAAAVDEYLGAHAPRSWAFGKGPEGYWVEQPSILAGRVARPSLGDLLEEIRRAAAAAGDAARQGGEAEGR